MIYTNEDKALMDEIFRAFGKYIREHKNFDIVYSKKVGYVKIAVDPYYDEEIRLIDSPEEFLMVLFIEITNDYLFHEKYHTYNDSSYRENVTLRISKILDTMGNGKEFAHACFDEYKQNCRTITTHKHKHIMFD